jgi:hypothetical protein
MPVRIPAARASEVAIIGAAGVTCFAPFYMMLPGAEERLASQTVHWAPRWERNISFFRNPTEKGVQTVAPHVERAVKKFHSGGHWERAAVATHRNIEKRFPAKLTKPATEPK